MFSRLRFFSKTVKDPIVVGFLVIFTALVIFVTVKYGDSNLSFWGSLSESPALVISFMSMLLAYWAVAATNRVADKAASVESSERRRGIEGSREYKDVLESAVVLADAKRVWQETGVWEALHFGACNRFEMDPIGERNPNLHKALVLDFGHVGLVCNGECASLNRTRQYCMPEFNSKAGEVERSKVALPWTREIETGRNRIRNFAFRVMSLLDMGGLTHEDAGTLLTQIGWEVFSASEVLDALEEQMTKHAKCQQARRPYDFEFYYRLRKLLSDVEQSFRYMKAKNDGYALPSGESLSVVDVENGRVLYPHAHEYDFLDACLYCASQPKEKLEDALKELSSVDIEKIRWGFKMVKMPFLGNRSMTACEMLVWKYALMRKLRPQDIEEESFGKGFSEAYEACCKVGSMRMYYEKELDPVPFQARFPELFPGRQVLKPDESQMEGGGMRLDLPEILESPKSQGVESVGQGGTDAS